MTYYAANPSCCTISGLVWNFVRQNSYASCMANQLTCVNEQLVVRYKISIDARDSTRSPWGLLFLFLSSGSNLHSSTSALWSVMTIVFYALLLLCFTVRAYADKSGLASRRLTKQYLLTNRWIIPTRPASRSKDPTTRKRKSTLIRFLSWLTTLVVKSG